jgi:uracil-DNA glycosylase
MRRITKCEYARELERCADDVYAHARRTRPRLRLFDHRTEYPWLKGSLGNPSAAVWFVGENPSLRQVEKLGRAATPEDQWAASKGDLLFRQMLVRHGYKRGTPLSRYGWNCYITNVVKSPDYVGDWRTKVDDAERARIVRAWAPVLRYQLELGRPKVVVSLGNDVDDHLTDLARAGQIPPLPLREKVWHYAWVAGKRPDKLKRTLDERFAAWSVQFDRVDAALAAAPRRSQQPLTA